VVAVVLPMEAAAAVSMATNQGCHECEQRRRACEATIVVRYEGDACMHGLQDALEQSQKDGVAIGHFNVGDWVRTHTGAVLSAARSTPIVKWSGIWPRRSVAGL
jgi:hypothetical protein